MRPGGEAVKLDAVLLVISSALTCALLLANLLRLFRLPAAIAYILTGLILGPSGFAFVQDQQAVAHIGELGVIMLMFFIGMEVSLPRLIAGWRVAVLGAMAQMAVSVLMCMLAAELLGWSWRLGLLLGFIISMSSTAVVMVMLKDAGELDTPFGQNALGVLLMQDMAIVPIMILLGMLGDNGAAVSPIHVALQLLGGAALVALDAAAESSFGAGVAGGAGPAPSGQSPAARPAAGRPARPPPTRASSPASAAITSPIRACGISVIATITRIMNALASSLSRCPFTNRPASGARSATWPMTPGPVLPSSGPSVA